jgi:hypothetical protein
MQAESKEESSMRTTSIATIIMIGFLAFAVLDFPAPNRAVAALPPRPTLTPTAENMARILLEAEGMYEGEWTVVQWQDGLGEWHDVGGWRGRIVNSQVRWRVAVEDFNTGPFRWVVYKVLNGDQDEGKKLAVSASFTLPSSASHLVSVTVTPVDRE